MKTSLRSVLIVAAAATAVYLNALPGEFVHDDNSQIANNPWLTSIRHLPKLLTSGVWQFRGMETNHFRPAQMTSYLVDRLLFGLNPVAFHVHNLLYHVLASIALLVLISRWTGSPEAALAGTLLFAVHPIQTEAVAWIAGMPDVGCGLFYVLTILLLILASESERGIQGLIMRALAAACFLLALAFKEMAATLPLVWPVIALSRSSSGRFTAESSNAFSEGTVSSAETASGATSTRSLAFDLATMGIVLIVYFVWRVMSLGGLSPGATQTRLGSGGILLNALWVPVRYVGLLIFPATLTLNPRYVPIESLRDPRLLVAVAGWGIVAVTVARLWRRGHRQAAASLACFLLSLLPVMNVNLVAGTLICEHYLYVPSLFFCTAAGLGYAALARRWRTAAIAGLGLILSVGAVRTFARNRDFRSNLRLFEVTAAQRPDSAAVLLSLGEAYERVGRFEEALASYRRSAELDPRNQRARYALVRLPFQRGRIEPAEAARRYEEVMAELPPLPGALYNYGRALLLSGRAGDAVEPLKSAFEADPSLVEAAVHLSTALAITGRQAESIDVCRNALESFPDSRALLDNLAFASAELGRWRDADEAIARLRTQGADVSRELLVLEQIRNRQGSSAPSGGGASPP